MTQQATVTIRKGSYRNQEVRNVTFPLLKEFTIGKSGGFVTVDGSEQFGEGYDKIRIKVAGPKDFTQEGGVPDVAATDPIHVTKTVARPDETDEQITTRIGKRFGILTDMTKAILNGDIRAMIVSGPPGVGKSFGIEREVEKSGMFDEIAGKAKRYEVVKGAMSPIGLYKILYQYHNKGDVLVFDDCDSILFDDLSLNLLKAALDSGKKRMIHWAVDSYALKNEGIPNSFEFKGAAIFITNLKFENVRSKKLQDHLAALQSRCHFLDLTMDTMREKLLRIKMIVNDCEGTGGLWEGYGFDKAKEQEILDFMFENKEYLREMSLRMGLKIGDLARISADWKEMARATCMRNQEA